MRTSNPVLNSETFEAFDSYRAESSNVMTINGTAYKTMILLVMALACAVFNWRLAMQGNQLSVILMGGGFLGGFILALITTFKANWSPVTAPIYASLEGLALGGISAFINAKYPGVAFQAVCLTFGTLFSLLLAYQTGLIRPSQQFKMGIAAATGGICLLYLVNLGMSFFDMSIPFIQGNAMLSIGFSVFVVIVAAANLVLDFDFIEQGAAHGAPKYMEWYGAFGLMVTLVWLYIEILRLLAKLRSRD